MELSPSESWPRPLPRFLLEQKTNAKTNATNNKPPKTIAPTIARQQQSSSLAAVVAAVPAGPPSLSGPAGIPPSGLNTGSIGGAPSPRFAMCFLYAAKEEKGVYLGVDDVVSSIVGLRKNAGRAGAVPPTERTMQGRSCSGGRSRAAKERRAPNAQEETQIVCRNTLQRLWGSCMNFYVAG